MPMINNSRRKPGQLIRDSSFYDAFFVKEGLRLFCNNNKVFWLFIRAVSFLFFKIIFFD